MTTFNNIKLAFNSNKTSRDYLSFSDMCNELTAACLIEILPTLTKMKDQMKVMGALENQIEDEQYFDLLETCNGI